MGIDIIIGITQKGQLEVSSSCVSYFLLDQVYRTHLIYEINNYSN